MKRIFFVYPNQTDLDEINQKYSHLGVGYRQKPQLSLGILVLISHLKFDHKIKYVDNNIEKLDECDLLNIILEWEPDIVGFGGTFTEWPQAMRLSQKLRDRSIKTIYGGPNATARPENHAIYFDHVFVGFAEESLKEFLKSGNSNTKIFYSNINPFENYYYPERSFISICDYNRSINPLPLNEPCDIIESVRGCSYPCRFCSTKTIWDRKSLQRDPFFVIDEIRYMKKIYGTKSVFFREDNFAENEKRLTEMCNALADINIEWVCQMRIKMITESNISMMKQAGCKTILCGWESANDDTLEYIKKGHTKKDIFNTIGILENQYMPYGGGFIVGLPNETEDHIRNTMNFVRKMRKSNLCHLPIGAMRFVGYPVSELYYEIIKDGLVEYNWHDGELLVPRTKYLTADQVSRIMEDEWY